MTDTKPININNIISTCSKCINYKYLLEMGAEEGGGISINVFPEMKYMNM